MNHLITSFNGLHKHFQDNYLEASLWKLRCAQLLLANEPTMLSVFKNNLDLHTYLASQVQQKPYEELISLKTEDPARFKEMRNPMKAVNFGLLYGMGAQTLWKTLLIQNHPMLFEYAKELHSTWHKTFPQIQVFVERCKHFFYNQTAPLPVLGGTKYITSLLGRIRRPISKKSKPQESYLSVTQLANFPIQATCADILKTSLLVLYKMIKTGELPAVILLSAHDEICLECAKADTEFVAQTQERVMIKAAQQVLSPVLRDAPVGVDIGIGPSWDAKP